MKKKIARDTAGELFAAVLDDNLLPYDGRVKYFGKIFGQAESDAQLENLLQKISWRNDEAIFFGKKIITKRKVAWYGDTAFPYAYSNATRIALEWTEELLPLKQAVESISGETFNACLLNLYHDGDEGMAWHSDDERTLQENAPIASLSFGAERRFDFKHRKSEEKRSLLLHHGSLLIMYDQTQSHWMHCPLPIAHSPLLIPQLAQTPPFDFALFRLDCLYH